MRAYFCAYFSLLEDWAELTDEEAGALFRACLSYASTGEEPELNDRTMRSLFRIQKKLIDSAQDHYTEVSRKRKAAIDSRWNASKDIQMNTNEYKRIQMNTNVGNKEERRKKKEYIPPYGGVGGQYSNPALESLEVKLT